MKIICSNCRLAMGLKEPLNDERETHGLCIPCATELYGDGIVDRAIAAMETKKTIPATEPESIRAADMTIGDYRLVLTCGACPEQYDVYRENLPVGYLRLRHGHFSADYIGTGEPATVYVAHPCGDGAFDSDQRGFFLRSAIEALDNHIYKLSKKTTIPEDREFLETL